MKIIDGKYAYQNKDFAYLCGDSESVVECFFVDKGVSRSFHVYKDVSTAEGDKTVLYLSEIGCDVTLKADVVEIVQRLWIDPNGKKCTIASKACGNCKYPLDFNHMAFCSNCGTELVYSKTHVASNVSTE